MSYYTNMVEGSLDIFKNRNTRVNLLLLGLFVNLEPPQPLVFYGKNNDDNNGDDPLYPGNGRGGATVGDDSKGSGFSPLGRHSHKDLSVEGFNSTQVVSSNISLQQIHQS